MCEMTANLTPKKERIVTEWLGSGLSVRQFALLKGLSASTVKRWAHAYAARRGFRGNLRDFAAEYMTYSAPAVEPKSLEIARMYREYLKRVVRGEAA